MRNTTCGTSTTAKARPKTTPALWGDSDGWPRTAEEHAQRNAHYSARRDLSDADRLDYNTVVKFGGQTAAERRAVSQEKKRSRDLARAKRTASRDP